MTNVIRDPQKRAYRESRGSAISVYIKAPALCLFRPELTGCSQGATKISNATRSPDNTGMESRRWDEVRPCVPGGKHRITNPQAMAPPAIVDSLYRLNVETPHPYSCLHSPKIANNVQASSGKHSTNTYPRTAF